MARYCNGDAVVIADDLQLAIRIANKLYGDPGENDVK